MRKPNLLLLPLHLSMRGHGCVVGHRGNGMKPQIRMLVIPYIKYTMTFQKYKDAVLGNKMQIPSLKTLLIQ